MFEILLNAARLALSKDARDSTAALIDHLTRSPEWQKEICTIEAKVPYASRERMDLIEDVVATKLMSLAYTHGSVTAFRTAFHELTTNAFEHGIINPKRTHVRAVVDISPTYVAVAVYNPKGSPFRLIDALESAASHLRETHKFGRGRGLLSVCRRADVTEMIGESGIKALVYRDAVDLITYATERVPIVVVNAGHTNPSLGRRVREYLDDLNDGAIVLCLDPNEFTAYKEKRTARDESAGVRLGSDAIFDCLSYAAQRNRQGHTTIRLVWRDRAVDDLLPRSLVDSTVAGALAALRHI